MHPGSIEILGWYLSWPDVILGLIQGAMYGILAVGLVLIYRTNRIINFAHGQIGVFGAAFLSIAVSQWGLPYWVFFPAAIAISAALGGLVETAVVRRLRRAPRLMSVIATLGAAQFLTLLALLINGQSQSGSLFPEPPGFPSFRMGATSTTLGVAVLPSQLAMLVLTPLIAAGLAAFLRWGRYGIAMRAAAANPESARLDGVFAARMSTLAWVIAGGIAAFTAILVLPTVAGGDTFGPGLLVRALAAAALARMSNLVVSFVAGLGIGVVERVITANNASGGTTEMVLFAIIVLGFLLLQPRGGRLEEKGSVWASVRGLRPLPDAYRRVWLIRHGGKLLAGLGLLLAALVPITLGAGQTVTFTFILAYAIVGMSLGVLSGLLGQVSLGQFAIAGIGAVVAIDVSSNSGNYLLGILAGGLAGAVSALILGIPALRIRGLLLGVTTLAFALVSSPLLQQPWMLGTGTNPGTPVVGGFRLDNAKGYYVLVLASFVVLLWLTANIRKGGIGRILVAIRDNEDAARAFTVSVAFRKLQGFMLSGAIAGIGGALFTFAISRVDATNFAASISISIVAVVVIGGISFLGGPLLGALYIFGLPAFLPLDSAGYAAQAGGWLLLVLYLPRGLGGVVERGRDLVCAWLARRAGVTSEETATPEPSARPPAPLLRTTPMAHAPSAPPSDLLVATGLRKRYGGVVAVDDVDITVRSGETLGLIGPNGAGKTTLFELLSGFSKADAGEILYDGIPMTRTLSFLGLHARWSTSPQRRARLGLVRSFQDAALFATMTVTDVLMLAQERSAPTTLVASLAGAREVERRKLQSVDELIDMMGLDFYRNKPVMELSTGTRRIVELASTIALEPKLLLLDEPSSGIAQRETEALGELLRRVKEHLGTTLVVIEHDIPLVMSIADRIVAMDTGRVIASGKPAEVRLDPRVVESYLGGDVTAIERSVHAPAAAGA